MKKITIWTVVLGISMLMGGCGIQDGEGRITRVVQEQATGDTVYKMDAKVPQSPEKNSQEKWELQTEASAQNKAAVQTEASAQNKAAVQTEASVQNKAAVQTEAPVQTEAQTDEYGRISREKAIAIVLSKIPGASEADVYMELDMDDGHWEYEGDVYYNFREYEFEINAMNGKILEWSEDDG